MIWQRESKREMGSQLENKWETHRKREKKMSRKEVRPSAWNTHTQREREGDRKTNFSLQPRYDFCFWTSTNMRMQLKNRQQGTLSFILSISLARLLFSLYLCPFARSPLSKIFTTFFYLNIVVLCSNSLLFKW